MSDMVDTVEKMTVLLAERDAEIARLKAMLERAYDKQAQKAIRNYTVNELGYNEEAIARLVKAELEGIVNRAESMIRQEAAKIVATDVWRGSKSDIVAAAAKHLASTLELRPKESVS